MRILKLIGAILIVFATPAFAKDGAWILTQKSGDVRVLRSGMQPASVPVRAALSPGDLVATGANGRAMLTRGDDYVVVAPGSRLLLPKEEQAKGLTRLIQQVGTMLYKVKHTGVPHFAVDTPMLAAVVKGTTFTVIVDDQRAAVQVTDGVVEVSAAVGSARRLVQRGMTVYVGRERPDEIVEMKAGEGLPVSSSGGGDSVKIAGSGEVPVSAITDLTGGLVREAPAVAAAPVATAPKPVEIVKATAPIAGDAPAADTTAPSVQRVVEPVTAVTAPVVNTVVAPIVETVTTVTAPVVNTVVTPIVETVTNVTGPVVNTVVAPIVETVTNVTAPIVQPVTTVVAPIVQPVTTVVAPIVQPVTTVVAPIVQPVTTVVAPVIAPVTTVTAPVIAPITTIVQPVTTILPGLKL